ncbi:hydroxyacylglutathione hydrolase [Pacificimonas flava]|uniref:Hydroxyacylglutathione hydrolase n=2 Tax=Pacificimonas TaxID=1960290 RepID=A0A219B2I9_9SPHN|nr:MULTISPECIES: hydroxyacylglutathione hydrolase [Pacificimonas]MBZ6377748.1 hydroxyacylglutathione hydrolase [Pacificimonas aurantium]OWV32577.1 hydroxyacylglutathione hydrolase [Pacificimonas flava]
MLDIVRIPALSDNYIWLARDSETGEAAVIDPAEAAPTLAKAEELGWEISQILNTHWHPDHVGGNAEIKDATGCKVTGPKGEEEKIVAIDRAVVEGDRVAIGSAKGRVIDVPGHTAGHNAYYFEGAGKDGEGVLFCGDTLFAMGCGRLFEGTPAQMHDSLAKLAGLPTDTKVYCAHEYTQANGRFALTAEPENEAIRRRQDQVIAMRERGEATVPTTIGAELDTNPFVRASDAEELGRRRDAKDSFSG